MTAIAVTPLTGGQRKYLLREVDLVAGLTSLRLLSLDGCFGIRRFAPLKSLLPTLKRLTPFGCKLDDLPPEVCGSERREDALDKVRAHYGLKAPKVSRNDCV